MPSVRLRHRTPSRALHLAVGLIALALGLAVMSGFVLSRSSASTPTSATSSSKARVATLTTPKAIVLGLIEGTTEYLPISSTGHLLVAERIMDVGQLKIDEAATDTYTVVIQIGAILAVLGIFRKRFVLMLQGVAGKSAEGRSLVVSLVLAFIPAVIFALALQDPIKSRLLKPWPVVVTWVLGGVAILLFTARSDRLKERISSLSAIPPRVALGIGAAQVLALWPGTSRSLVTILAALLLGCSLTVAVEFSFLLGFITLSAATGYELLKNGSTMIDAFGIVNPLIGIVVAGVAAFISVRWMITYLEKHPLTVFAWYRFGIAGLTAVLLITKVI